MGRNELHTGSTSTFSHVSGPSYAQKLQQHEEASEVTSSILTPQAAEINAMHAEAKTQDKVNAKKQKLDEFRAKTAQAAKQKLKMQKEQQKNEAEAKRLINSMPLSNYGPIRVPKYITAKTVIRKADLHTETLNKNRTAENQK